MGAIHATCGHQLKKFAELKTQAVKYIDRDGSKCVSYEILCPKCYKEYKKKKLILKTEKDCEKYLRSNNE